LAEQYLTRAGDLLESRGHVDGVAKSQRLCGGSVPGQYLASVDARAQLERHPVVANELGVQLSKGGSQLGGGPHRPQSIVLADHGDAEHRHDRVADELLDGATVALNHRPVRSKYRPMTRVSDSGSKRSPSPVEPARSLNTTVTAFRTRPASSWSRAIAAPQLEQNRAPSGLGAPQTTQAGIPALSWLPLRGSNAGGLLAGQGQRTA
jgi:hypothetical protein